MSTTTIKNGKKPLSSKKPNSFSQDSLFGSQLDIPAEIQAEIDEQGLVAHWIDAQDVYKSGGYHKRGWVPYRRKIDQSANMNTSEFKFGRDPEGLVRMGSMILGVKTKEKVAEHKAYLAQKADRFKTYNKDKARELKQLAKEANLDSLQIHEGFEDNED